MVVTCFPILMLVFGGVKFHSLGDCFKFDDERLETVINLRCYCGDIKYHFPRTSRFGS